MLSSLQVEPLGWQLCSRSLLPWVAFIDSPSWPFRYLSNSGPHIVKEFFFPDNLLKGVLYNVLISVACVALQQCLESTLNGKSVNQ